MGIENIYDDDAICRHTRARGAYRAALICDECGEEIRRPDSGNVVFDRSTGAICNIVHKACSSQLSRGVLPPLVPWNDIGHFVAELNQALGDAVNWSRECEERLHAEPTDDPD